MDNRQRDFTIALIRSGIFTEGNFRIFPTKAEDILESHRIYQEGYDEALKDGLMTTSDIDHMMQVRGLWGDREEKELKDMEKQVENIKCLMFQKRKDKKYLKSERKNLRLQEVLYSNKASKKSAFYSNTCESFAESARLVWLLQRCSFVDGELVDDDYDVNQLVAQYNKSLLADSIIRELARNEPWKSLWSASVAAVGQVKLFYNPEGTDVTINQKNLILWSNTYDKIHESPDCPEEAAIQDDDLLDGWFIHSRREREKEKRKAEIDAKMSNVKSKGADETFIMVNNREDLTAADIYDLNDGESRGVIRKRQAAIQKLNKDQHIEFENLPDVQQTAREQVKQAVKQRTGRN